MNFIHNPLHSGLGNVLYLIASTYGIAYKNKLLVYIPLDDFFLKWGEKYKKSILRNVEIEKRTGNAKKIYEIKIKKNTYFSTNCGNNSELVGYFQSYKYFVDIQQIICDLFSIDNNTNKYITEKYKKIFDDTTVSIHVRRSDFCTIGVAVDVSYYQKAIKYVKSHTGESNIKFIVFSDDIEWCKKYFSGSEYYFMENEDDYVDLYTMSLCDHNIIANSTFSWWGAFLNKNNNKIVLYPKDWFSNKKNYEKIKNDTFPIEWVDI